MRGEDVGRATAWTISSRLTTRQPSPSSWAFLATAAPLLAIQVSAQVFLRLALPELLLGTRATPLPNAAAFDGVSWQRTPAPEERRTRATWCLNCGPAFLPCPSVSLSRCPSSTASWSLPALPGCLLPCCSPVQPVCLASHPCCAPVKPVSARSASKEQGAPPLPLRPSGGRQGWAMTAARRVGAAASVTARPGRPGRQECALAHEARLDASKCEQRSRRVCLTARAPTSSCPWWRADDDGMRARGRRSGAGNRLSEPMC